MNKPTETEIALPEVTTYDRAELSLETGFTENTSNATSDRNVKCAIRSLGRRITLGRLVGAGR